MWNTASRLWAPASRKPEGGSMRRMIVLVLTFALGLLALVPSASAGDNFVAPLSGAEEVPARATPATGVAKFKLREDGTVLLFKVNVASIENVVAAHIHCGAVGVNGPVGVTLFSAPPAGGAVEGTLAEGTITAPDPGNACGPGRDRKRGHIRQRAHQRRSGAGKHRAWGLPRRGDSRPDPVGTVTNGSWKSPRPGALPTFCQERDNAWLSWAGARAASPRSRGAIRRPRPLRAAPRPDGRLRRRQPGEPGLHPTLYVEADL